MMTSQTRILAVLLMAALCVGAAQEPDPDLVVLPAPQRVEDILTQLKIYDGHVSDLIARGNFAGVYVPAFQAKDLAIALEGRLDSIDAPHRDAAAPAILDVVRLAWVLDSAGDAGNRQQLVAAQDAFSAALGRVIDAFGG